MFRSLKHDDASSTYFIGPDADGVAYWQHQTERHGEHRRSVISLTVAIGAILLLALVVDPVLAWCAAFLIPFLGIQWWLARRTRPTMKFPDFRSPDPVDVPLDRD